MQFELSFCIPVDTSHILMEVHFLEEYALKSSRMKPFRSFIQCFLVVGSRYSGNQYKRLSASGRSLVIKCEENSVLKCICTCKVRIEDQF